MTPRVRVTAAWAEGTAHISSELGVENSTKIMSGKCSAQSEPGRECLGSARWGLCNTEEPDPRFRKGQLLAQGHTAWQGSELGSCLALGARVLFSAVGSLWDL